MSCRSNHHPVRPHSQPTTFESPGLLAPVTPADEGERGGVDEQNENMPNPPGGEPPSAPDAEEEPTAPVESDVPCQPRPPIQPSAAMVDYHLASGHAVFRNWCRACVAARQQEWPHRRVNRSANCNPILTWDYGYLGSDSPEQMPKRKVRAVPPFWFTGTAAPKGIMG